MGDFEFNEKDERDEHGERNLPDGSGGTEPGNRPDEPGGVATVRSYKDVCARLGFVMSVYFICRILGGMITGLLVGLSGDNGRTAVYIMSMSVTVIMVYIVPLLATAIVFKSFRHYGEAGGLRALYKKPRRLARALGTFPAMYGLGYGIALLTLLISYLISRVTGGQTFIEDLFRPTAADPSTSVANAVVMVFLLVIVAPVLEEIWVRGIMYDALKPYGCGIAIVISSILFGLMHGSMHMLFYTTALGFALGYIRYATDSLFVVTILHAIINAVAAGLLLISALAGSVYGESRLFNTVFNIYILAMLILIVVGVIAFIMRIPVIRKYKIENVWSEISPGRKTALFFMSIPVIIMLVLAFNEHTNDWLRSLIMV